jgi:hypothetical protein
LLILVFSLLEFQELVAFHAHGAIGGRHEDAVRCHQDRTLIPVGEAKTLSLQFGSERSGSIGKSRLEPRPVEARRGPFCPLACRVGETLDPCFAALGPGGLDKLAMVGFVAPREVFEAAEVVPAIEDPQRGGVHLGKRDMKVGSALLHMPNHKPGAIRANVELDIDCPNERAELRGRHFAFRGNRKMPNVLVSTQN